MLKRRKIFYGWWLVLAAAAMNVFAGGIFYYGFTVISVPAIPVMLLAKPPGTSPENT